MADKITIEVEINAPIEKVWEYWTEPKHITNWNFASDDWCCPKAENDLKVGGKFSSTMSAKDNSFSFDFNGVYDKIILHREISYSIDPMYYKKQNIPARIVKIEFKKNKEKTKVVETFDPEEVHPIEQQKQGWQSILNNFKKYVEKNSIVKIHFEIEINAPAKKVFETMLTKKSYEEWARAFNPTSSFQGSWEKGSKILFFGTDEKGKKGGMISKIKENIPHNFLSIEHQGILEEDKEILSGPKVWGWKGAIESYTFKEKDGKTNLIIETDTIIDYKDYFEETWPKALKILKDICEN